LEILRKSETTDTPGEDGINMKILKLSTNFLNISIDVIDTV
jgi:hypothetical protein